LQKTKPNQFKSFDEARTCLLNFFEEKEKAAVLTGAGISVGSGIPSYRNEQGEWKAGNPIAHRDFVEKENSRQRYWLRSYAGWRRVSEAKPSKAHFALQRLQAEGKISTIITQNVDRLHQSAGSKNILDLHGRLDQVTCLNCAKIYRRSFIQVLLKKQNPFLKESESINPDGDAKIESPFVGDLKTPSCLTCGGILKPNVVFFGDSVDKNLVEEAYESVTNADALIVIGTSLSIFSGFRFLRHAAKLKLPVMVINPGRFRGEELANIHLPHKADDVLPLLV
tara:strand:- start:3295 stop:4137 length:843 start_codon:yes stop_codon:yes gene_type:complete